MCAPIKKPTVSGGLFRVSLKVGLRESPSLIVMPMVAMGVHQISG